MHSSQFQSDVRCPACSIQLGLGNAIVCFNTADGSLKTTVDGSGFWSMSYAVGTLNTSAADTIFKVQYYMATARSTEEWHGNGMLRFKLKDGTPLIAFTHRKLSEVRIV